MSEYDITTGVIKLKIIEVLHQLLPNFKGQNVPPERTRLPSTADMDMDVDLSPTYLLSTQLLSNNEPVRCLALHPSSSQLLSVSQGSILSRFNLDDGSVDIQSAGSDTRHPHQITALLSSLSCDDYSSLPSVYVTGCDDGIIRVMDGKSHQLKFTLEGHTDAVSSLSWIQPPATYAASREKHPPWLVSGSWDGTAKLWDVFSASSPQCLGTLAGHENAVSVAGLPAESDSVRKVVTASAGIADGKVTRGHTVRIWRLSRGNLGDSMIRSEVVAAVADGHSGPMTDVCYDAVTHSIFTCSYNGTVKVRSAEDGVCQATLAYPGFRPKLLSLCVVGKTDRCVVAGAKDGNVVVWDISGNKNVQVIPHPGCVWKVLAMNDDFVTACHDGTLRIFTRHTDRAAHPDVVTSFKEAVTAWKNFHKTMEGIEMKSHLKSVPMDVLCNHHIEDEPAPQENAGVVGAIEMLGDKDEPIPFGRRSHIFEGGPKSNEKPESERMLTTPGSTQASRENVGIGAAIEMTGDTDGHMFETSGIDPLLATPGNTRSIVQGNSILLQAYTNMPPQSPPNDHDQEGEEEENENAIIIPDAYLVAANVSVDGPDVGVAELVERDKSTVLLKKRHACVASIFIAATLITVGLLTRRSSRTNETPAELSVQYAIEKNVLQQNVVFDGMEATDVRVLALDWINDKDPMELDASASNLFQRYILVLLAYEYSSLDWLSDGDDECKWSGVECDMNGHVIKLELADFSLDGTMPPEIGRLQSLQVLNLSDNSLHGTLPSELGHLNELSSLSLGANNFTGALPSEIGNLKVLTELDLTKNEFTGTLPSELGLLTSLMHLSVNTNMFTGTLPSELGLLTSLTELWLGDNQYIGTLPSELGLLTSLISLSVDTNKFTGTLPSELGLLTSLSDLKVNDNRFEGTLPSELSRLTSLLFLSVNRNKFTGTLPSELGLLTLLTDLRVNDNEFRGTLPSKLGLITSLMYLYVDENMFTGTIPSEVGLLTSLRSLSFSNNYFTGTLPFEFGNLTSLTYLHIGGNQFSGTFPSPIKGMFEVSELFLNYNQFVGTLPTWIGDLQDLTNFWLYKNTFHGTLPSELGKLTSLTSLDISYNEFTGKFPTWIRSLKNLSFLWIHNNQFTGTFPSEIGSSLVLRDFCIRNNDFTGTLPKEVETRWPCN
ncbi:hypothetical protein ACHAW6_004341 [Cyclotella cf. meneghiniana]